MTMKDKHHGTWSTEANNTLKLEWKSIKGFATFKVVQNTQANQICLSCTGSGWDFMKTWSLMFTNTSNQGLFAYNEEMEIINP